jgi:hypothetical protein
MAVICPTCKKKNEKEDTMKIGNKYYCIECGEKREEELNNNKDGWDELFEYICELYKIKKPTGMMFKQIKEFRNEPYKYTNWGMLATLKYYHETLDNPVLEDAGIGIIPYYYDRTAKHYNKKYQVEEYMDNFESEEVTKTVSIKPSSKKRNHIKQLSFSSIVEGEEDGEQ